MPITVNVHTGRQIRCVFLFLYCLQYWSLLNWQNLRLRSGSCKLIFWHYFIILLLNLRTLYIVWSLVKSRVARRLTRLKTMCNVLKYRKILYNIALRLRCGCVYFFNWFKTSIVRHWLLHKALFRRSRQMFAFEDIGYIRILYVYVCILLPLNQILT